MPFSYPDDPRILNLDTPAKQEGSGLVAFDQNGSPAEIFLENLEVQGGDSNIIGEIRMYSGPSAPDKWLLCDGSAISRSTYADLFALIGESFGVGDGSTTFNIPDFAGRSPVGVGAGAGLTARALADVGGEEEHQLIVNELAEHRHVIPGSFGTSGSYITFSGPSTGSERYSDYEGGDQPHNTMHPFLAINFIIFSGVSV